MTNNSVEKKTTLYIILVFMSFSQIIFECLGQTQITSALFYLSFVLLLYIWISFREEVIRSYDLRIIIIAFLCVLNICIEILVDNGSFSSGTFKKIIFLISYLVIYRVSLDTLNADRVKKWYGILAVLSSLFFIFMFYTDRALVYTRSNYGVTQYLTLNLENPNKAALFIGVIMITNIVSFFSEKRFLRKLILFVCSGFFIYFMLETGSRGGELTMALFLVTILLFRRKKKAKVPKAVNFSFAVFPFVFAAIYMLYIDKIMHYGYMDFLVSDGKELSSRVSIWSSAFYVIKTHWLTGGYSLLTYGSSGLFQMHNTHLDVFATFGIVVFIMYVRFLYDILCDLSGDEEMEFERFYYFLAFAFTILLGCSEAAAVNGTNGLPILTAAFIAICKNCGEKQESQNELL